MDDAASLRGRLSPRRRGLHAVSFESLSVDLYSVKYSF